MIMGSLLILSGYTLYWMLRPPIPHDLISQENFEFPREPSLNSEGVAGCLISQPSIR